jgi:hypothetical protein
MELSSSSDKDRRFYLQIKPLGILIILVFLLSFNAIAVFSYEYGSESLRLNILFYMYFYFWITFFLVAIQVKKIIQPREAKEII